MSDRLKRGTRKEVYLFYPDSLNFDPLTVDQEVEIGLICHPHEGVVYRYQKQGPGWNSDKRRLWLASPGVPLTSYLNAGKPVKSSMKDFLIFAWGENEYNKLPPHLSEPIESTAYGATVTVEPVQLTKEQEKTLSSVSAYQILRQHVINVFRDFAVAEPTKDAGEVWMNRLLWLGLGAFIMYFGLKQGII